MLLLDKLETVIKDWLYDTGRQGSISSGHLHLMCLYLEQILESSIAPINITVIESQETVGNVIANFITSTIPSYKVELSRVNILSDNIYPYDKPVDLVVTSQKLLPFLKRTRCFSQRDPLVWFEFGLYPTAARRFNQNHLSLAPEPLPKTFRRTLESSFLIF